MTKIKYARVLYLLVLSGLLFTSCGTRDIRKPNDIKITPTTSGTQDDCCDVKYPALQAEVSGIDLFQKQFQLTSFRDPTTGNFKYKLQHSPSPNYISVSQAYVNYVNALYPCVTKTGSEWKLSKGNFGPGHTTRQVAWPNWIGFQSGSLSSTMAIHVPSNFWSDYYDPPIVLNASGATPAVNGGLDVNQIYSIEYGFWIEDATCNLTQKERECMGYHTWTNFRIQASGGPLLRTNGKEKTVTVNVEFFDEKGTMVDKREMKVIRK